MSALQDQRGAPNWRQVLQRRDEREPDAGTCLDEVGLVCRRDQTR
jgi:hypothetical protein